MTRTRLENDLDVIQVLHRHQNRKWDKDVPYWVHPMWCATMILCEPLLDKGFRHKGAIALMYHDIIEAGYEMYVPSGVKGLVDELTFSGFDEEMEKIWDKSNDAKLLKLYDKVSNILDGHWMDDIRKAQYRDYTLMLVNLVTDKYGDLQICKIARAILF